MNANRIKQLCEERKMTLKEMAESVGITEGGFHQSVRNNSFKVSTLEKVAKLFKVPISFFFNEADKNITDKTIIEKKRAKVVYELHNDEIILLDLENRKLEILKK